MIFDQYADIYDLLNNCKDYAAEASYAIDRLQLAGPSFIAEIGCGSGRHAIALAEAGHRIAAADPSAAMLRQAEERVAGSPREVAARIRFHLGRLPDVRDQDAAIALFHVASYAAADPSGITGFALAAASLLRPGGRLFFDWWHDKGVLRDPPSVRVKRAVGGQREVVRISEPLHDPAQMTVVVRFQAFHRDGNGPWKEFRENHRLRYLSADEVAAALTVAGFGAISTTAWRQQRPADEHDWYACTSATLLGHP